MAANGRTAFGGLKIIAVALVIAEFSLRLVSGGCFTFVPYVTNNYVATLPANSDFCVLDSGRRRIQYVTDRWSARRRSSADSGKCTRCVLTVGDSQALGFGLQYDETFSALYSRRRGLPSVILAAPAADPDGERLSASRYIAESGATPQVTIVVVNLGNDVDELLLARQSAPPSQLRASVWLGQHSRLYSSIALVVRRFHHGLEWIPPGTNPVAFALEPDDLPVVVHELRDAVVSVARETRARETIVVVIPPDYLIDPREFEKYRPFYRAEEFAAWRERIPRMAHVMTAIEDGLTRELRASALQVVDARAVLEAIRAEGPFDRYSHHLTVVSNRAIAVALP